MPPTSTFYYVADLQFFGFSLTGYVFRFPLSPVNQVGNTWLFQAYIWLSWPMRIEGAGITNLSGRQPGRKKCLAGCNLQ